jgi:hypothetical protein
MVGVDSFDWRVGASEITGDNSGARGTMNATEIAGCSNTKLQRSGVIARCVAAGCVIESTSGCSLGAPDEYRTRVIETELCAYEGARASRRLCCRL